MEHIFLCDDDLLSKLIAENPHLIDECIETLDAINRRYSDEFCGTVV